MTRIEISLVIPTFNERPNIEPLLAEIEAALLGYSWEALFVDDSTDATDALIARLGEADSRVRLHHRTVNRDGLAGAVVEGFAEARGDSICILDADLQHPPATIPVMLAEARRRSADIVIASRYLPGGSTGGLDGPMRQISSRGSRLLSRLMFPKRLAAVTDPLGGFFLVSRSTVDGVSLRPVGYKILLEILIRCRWQTVREVPYHFQPRRHGTSKAGVREGLRFLRHLAALRRSLRRTDASP